MKRDTLKTIGGLVIIGLIVVVTFLYGNAQRQSQLRHDQDVKRQQQAQTATKAKTPQAQSSTQPQTQPKTAAAAPTTTIPDTGASENALIPVTLLGMALYGLLRSRRSLAVTIRTR